MTLAMALAILGAVVLAALIAHGAWQQRRAAGRRALAEGAVHEAQEPTLHDTVPADLDAGDDVAAPAPELPRLPRRHAERLDALIDAIAPLAVEVQVSGDMALAHLPASRRAGAKPFLIEGLNVDSGEWETPALGQRYREFQAGVLLANRTGALNEIEYSEFVQKVQAFADAIGALPDFPDMLDVVARACELGAFAGQHDAQLAVHLKANRAAWSLRFLEQQAAQHGFREGLVPGRLVVPAADEGAPPMLVLGFDPQAALADDPQRAVVGEATLAFDVPQTPAAARPFGAWRSGARTLAASLDASVVDDNGQPLSEAGFDAIGAELEQLYARLEARELAAGSPAARRLFS